MPRILCFSHRFSFAWIFGNYFSLNSFFNFYCYMKLWSDKRCSHFSSLLTCTLRRVYLQGTHVVSENILISKILVIGSKFISVLI